MTFSDKLTFLMRLTQTANKDLAQELSVDRSLISLLRSGKRGTPRNKDHIRRMAAFFAGRIDADYQRQALAEMLEQYSLRAALPPQVLSQRLERWLLGETDIVEHIVEGLHAQPAPTPEAQGGKVQPAAPETVYYFGNEGRREAMRLAMERPWNQGIWIADSSDLSWALEDYEFSNALRSRLKKLLDDGYPLRQLLPPVSNLGMYSEALQIMLPLYATGRSQVLYYPRIWNAPYDLSVIILPGQCVITTTGSNRDDRGLVSMVTTEPALIAAYMEQFNTVAAVCRPAITVHTKPGDFFDSMSRVLASREDILCKVAPLSTPTIPVELLGRLCEQTTNPVWKRTFRRLIQVSGSFEERLKDHFMLDIVRLSTADRVRTGAVPVGSPSMPYEGHPCYTPETYVLHLQNILRLMDTYQNYCFVPIGMERYPGYNLIVSGDSTAVMASAGTPSVLLEMHRPEIVMACREHLLRVAGVESYDSIRREKIRSQLRGLIRELEGGNGS